MAEESAFVVDIHDGTGELDRSHIGVDDFDKKRERHVHHSQQQRRIRAEAQVEAAQSNSLHLEHGVTRSDTVKPESYPAHSHCRQRNHRHVAHQITTLPFLAHYCSATFCHLPSPDERGSLARSLSLPPSLNSWKLLQPDV